VTRFEKFLRYDPAVRWMARGDVPTLRGFGSGTAGVPWCDGAFLACLEHPNVRSAVAELDGCPVGYLVAGMGNLTGMVWNLCVHPSYRRIGVGTALVERLFVWARRTTPVKAVFANVHESDLGTQLFFRSCGFHAAAVLRGKFADGADAYRFEVLP
jgi:[ribosomal protein S18]-alanine N-acetyltransferase